MFNFFYFIFIYFIFFYTIYIFGVLFFVEFQQPWAVGIQTGTPSLNYVCDSIRHCYITLMRLSFFDGNGFDFLTSLSNSGQSGLAFLAIVYMIMTATIFLNGLIGIFGDAFSGEEEEEEEKEKEEQNEKRKQSGVEMAAAGDEEMYKMMQKREELSDKMQKLSDVLVKASARIGNLAIKA